MKELKRFVLMLQFMTRIPIPVSLEVDEDDFGRGSKYFPIIGFILGLALYFTYYISQMELPDEISVIIAVAMSYVLTGSMHIDGLADTFDGLFSAKSREKILEIMKDSRIGTNGVLAILFMVLLKIFFLANTDPLYIPVALIIAPVMGRLAMLPALVFSKSAREGKGLGGLFIGKVKYMDMIIGLAFALIIGFFFSYVSYADMLFITAAVLLSGFIITAYIQWRIGGMTGDTLGSISEITELIVYAYIFLSAR